MNGGYPPQSRRNRIRTTICASLTALALISGCSSKPADAPPPTIEPAQAAVSPPVTTVPAGQVLPLRGRPNTAVFDHDTASLAVLTPGPGGAITVFSGGGESSTLPLMSPATALCGDGHGTVFAATRGGILTVDLRAGSADWKAVPGLANADFTAVAHRADGRLVLGSADGKAYTLNKDLSVGATASSFARVDAIVTVGDTAVVLDRAQTSVTSLNDQGEMQFALRAGQGATTMAADPVGRILVADTRAGQLLVFSADPLIERQASPVPDAPYGLTGSSTLVWVSQTATNTVVGYDLSTGTPVEKVRYPTVQQPDSLAFDDTAGTLYVVSGSGAGVQVIRNAGAAR